MYSCSSGSRSRSIQGIVSRLSSLFKNLSYSSSPFPSSEKKSLRYCSTMASSSRSAGYSSFYSISSKGESPIYRNASQWKRPPTILKLKKLPHNSVSFIGSLVLPVKKYNNSDFVWTVLEAKSPAKSHRNLRILLEMRGKMAKISLQHMVQNDFVYVSGHLDSFTKVDSSGRVMIFYKVIVKELNYVIRNNPDRSCHKPESLKLDAVAISRQQPPLDNKNEGNDRLHLWQIFFANPHEWWDNRQKKLYPRAPDFRHKDTGERLWITPNDPPWVARQLQLLDFKITERGHRDLGKARCRLSIWEYED